MSRQVLMTLLIAIVLLHIMQVIATNHNGALHLGRNNLSRQDASTNRDVPSEGAFLVNVGTGDG